jgi:glycopeptide antibiotics resistance protein
VTLHDDRTAPLPQTRTQAPLPRKSRARLAIATVLLVAYAAVVVTATMWPTPIDRNYGDVIARALEIAHNNGVPSWFGYNKLEFTANIGMFVPLGFFIALVLPWRVWWLVFLITPAASACIELAQAQFLAQRYSSMFDVIANSTGGWIGGTGAAFVRAVVYRRDRFVVNRALVEAGYRPRVH